MEHPDSHSSRLRLVCFGGLTLLRANGSSAGQPRRKPLAILALLAAHPYGLPRDSVSGYLWPDASPRLARRSLAQAIYALRQELGVSAIEGDGTLKLVEEVVSSDLRLFEQHLFYGDVAKADEISRAPFLDCVYFQGCLEFEHWSERYRSDVDRRLVDAMLQRARRLPATDPHERLQLWQRLLARCPLNSTLVGEAAVQLSALGERGAALAILRHHFKELKEEFGAAPPAALAALLEEVYQAPDACSASVSVVDARVSHKKAGTLDDDSVEDHSASPNAYGRIHTASVVSADLFAKRWKVASICGFLAAVMYLGASGFAADGKWVQSDAIPAGRSSSAAEDFYNRGERERGRGRDGLLAARRLYGSAIKLDSSFGPALARYAETTARLRWFMLERDDRRLAEAEHLLARALALDVDAKEVVHRG